MTPAEAVLSLPELQRIAAGLGYTSEEAGALAGGWRLRDFRSNLSSLTERRKAMGIQRAGLTRDQLCKHGMYGYEPCSDCEIDEVIEKIARWIEREADEAACDGDLGGDEAMLSDLANRVRGREWE